MGSSPTARTKGYFVEQYSSNYPESSKISIVNVCVADPLRGSGVGKKMLQDFISLHRGKNMELVVLAGSENAIRLYEGCGFEIVKKMPGFSLETQKPECYKMTHTSAVEGKK